MVRSSNPGALPASANGAPVPALEVAGLTKTYSVGGFGKAKMVKALAGVDLTLGKGEILGLVGESGSGKTTLVRTIALLERPTAGEVRVEGRAIPSRPNQARLREHRRHVQMIFQDPYSSLDALHKVRYTVTRPLRAFGVVPRSGQRAAAQEILEQVGLAPAADFLERYPYELSGGQRQRVGVARALAARPTLLLADEPTSMLDVSIRLNLMNLLLDLRQSQSLSLVFVTHDLAGASYMSDRIAIMYAGHLVELGPAEAVMGSPRHPYTQLLRQAAPDPSTRLTKAQSFDPRGEPPDLSDLPPGCPFAPRCPYSRSDCQDTLPEWRQSGPGHNVRCVLY